MPRALGFVPCAIAASVLAAPACVRSGFDAFDSFDASLPAEDGAPADRAARDGSVLDRASLDQGSLDRGVLDRGSADQGALDQTALDRSDATLPAGDPPGQLVVTLNDPSGLRLHVPGGFELLFDPLQGGVIDVWHDLALDPQGATNLTTDVAYNNYDGLFFQRTKFGANWRPQAADGSAVVTLVATNPVRSVVSVHGVLDDPSFDFAYDQLVSVYPNGRLAISAEFEALAAATPDEITYGLGVTHALAWEHATSEQDPFPLRVETAAPSYILHRAPLGNATVATMLVPLDNRTGLDWIFGVYDLDNVQYIYYHQDGRVFAANESLRRSFALFVKPGNLADPARALAHALDVLQPIALTLVQGETWPGEEDGYNATSGAYLARATINGLAATLPVAQLTRYKPAFRIGSWPSLTAPIEVALDSQIQVAGRDYQVGFEPVAHGIYFDGALGLVIADGGDPALSANESLADPSDLLQVAFASDAEQIVLGFADVVTGLLVEVDPRLAVTSSSELAWQYYSATGWKPLTIAAGGAATDLKESGHVVFALPADWVRWRNGTDQPALYYVRASRANSLPCDPPLPIRRISADVLDLQLYRSFDRDLSLTITPMP